MPTRLGREHTRMLMVLAWKNVRVRYRSSVLGLVWTLLHPLLFLGIFLLIFSEAFPIVPSYPVYALTGLVLWTYFTTCTGHIMGSLLENAGVLRSIAVPPLAFPISQSLAGTFSLLLSFIPMAGIIAWAGWAPSWVAIWLLPITLLFAVFTFGIGLGLCALNIYFRDVSLLWNSLMPALFYLTPIAYPLELVPKHLRWVVELNPMHTFIAAARGAVVEAQAPQPITLLKLLLIASCTMLLGLLVHARLKRGYLPNY